MNEPLNWVFGIVGVFGFFLAFALAWLEWHRYRIPLQMDLREVKYVGQSGDIHLVLLSLAFVNPASAGKTVFHILGGAPSSEVFSVFPGRYQADKDSIIFQLPDSDKAVILQRSELLLPPLDIPPNRSETKWHPAQIQHKAVKLVNQQSQVHLHLIAEDVFGKKLAEYEKDIELKTYML